MFRVFVQSLFALNLLLLPIGLCLAQTYECFPDGVPDAECSYKGRRFPVSQLEQTLIADQAYEPLLALVKSKYGYKSFLPPSSEIVEARYYESSPQGYFTIKFNSADTEYLFAGMTPALWSEFHAAPSHAEFYQQKIKGRYHVSSLLSR